MTTLPKFMGGALTLPGCARKTALPASASIEEIEVVHSGAILDTLN